MIWKIWLKSFKPGKNYSYKIRKMTFKNFGFTIQEKNDNPNLGDLLDKITNTKK